MEDAQTGATTTLYCDHLSEGFGVTDRTNISVQQNTSPIQTQCLKMPPSACQEML